MGKVCGECIESGCEVRRLGEERRQWGELSRNYLMEEDFVWDLEVCHLFRLSEKGSKGLNSK